MTTNFLFAKFCLIFISYPPCPKTDGSFFKNFIYDRVSLRIFLFILVVPFANVFKLREKNISFLFDYW